MGPKKLKTQLQQLLRYIEAGDKENKKVSHASTYWHIEHCLKVVDGIVTLLEQSTPADFKPQFSLMKIFILTTGYIPRGKGRAPKQTMPDDLSTKITLKAMHEQVRLQVLKLPDIPATSCFKHPAFGYLNKKQTIRFIGIHTSHHLKIMKDITSR